MLKTLLKAIKREQESVEEKTSLRAKHKKQHTVQAHQQSQHHSHSNHYHKAVFSWTAPQYIQHEKGKTWYIVAGIIALLFIIGALIFQNWSFALAVLIFSIVYYYFQKHHSPQDVHITISEMGIKIGETIYPYSNIRAFWIIYHPPFIKTLNLRIHKNYFWDTVIQLEDQDPAEIRRFLCGEIPEWEGKHERLGDVIIRLLKL